MSTNSIKAVLLVEDNPGDGRLLREMFNEQGANRTELAHVESMREAEKYLAEHAVDVILLDLGLPDAQGLEGVRRAHAAAPTIPLVVLTGLDDESTAAQALQEGAQDCLVKGQIEPRGLLRAMRYATERERAEGDLRASETRYRRLFEAAHDGILILNADSGAIIDVNPFLTDLLGFSHAELLGRKLWEIGPLHDVFLSKVEFDELKCKGYVRYEHLPLQTRTGRHIDVEFVSNVYLSNDRKVIQCNIRDITERKRVQDRLQEYEKAVEGLDEMIVVLDREYRYVIANRAFLNYRGKTSGQIVGQSVSDFLDEDLFAGVAKKIMDECFQGKVIKYELKYKHPEIGERDIFASYFPIEGRAGIDRIACVLQDITENKRAEAERMRLLTAIEQAAEGVVVTDTKGEIQYVNPAFSAMTGYSREEAIGQNTRILKSGQQDAAFYTSMWATLRAGQLWRGEMINRRRDGSLYTEQMSITPVYNEHGEMMHFVAMIEDITARKVLEDQIRQAQKMEAALIMQDVAERRKIAIVLEETRQARARLQEAFLSHVSHELRTPLTAIYFFTTNVLDGLFGDLTPPQREHLTFALDNVQQLKDMVSDLLDITRVDAHKLIVEPQHANPVKLIAEALSTCRKNAAAKNISLRSDVAPGLPFVWADPARVRQILINLIDNAIKFTPDAGIIRVGSRPVADDGFLCLSVFDTGCGISPENVQIVFDRLAQVQGSAEASRSGLGLGLFISRELVLQQGGRIWVESQLGHGSTFCFTLPLFSLAKLCAPVFDAPKLDSDCITLIAVDVSAAGGEVQADILPEIRKVLERCIHPGPNVVLPSMGDANPAGTFFIVASTDPSGFEAIASRIVTELQQVDHAAKLKPVISTTTLCVSPGQSREEQIGEFTAQIEQWVQTHLVGEGSLK
jgi:PAS domain S-box-containing protein